MRDLFARSLLLISLLALLAASAVAQEDTAPPAQQPRKIKTMLDYQKELGLTDKQVTEIKETLTNFQTNVLKLRNAWIKSEVGYKKLIQDHASLEDIKKHLIVNAQLRVNMRYLDVVTSRKVEKILKPEQLEKWKALQTKMRAQQKKPEKK